MNSKSLSAKLQSRRLFHRLMTEFLTVQMIDFQLEQLPRATKLRENCKIIIFQLEFPPLVNISNILPL